MPLIGLIETPLYRLVVRSFAVGTAFVETLVVALGAIQSVLNNLPLATFSATAVFAVPAKAKLSATFALMM
jgi:hypothetical protein